jgi:hypothetical protein
VKAIIFGAATIIVTVLALVLAPMANSANSLYTGFTNGTNNGNGTNVPPVISNFTAEVRNERVVLSWDGDSDITMFEILKTPSIDNSSVYLDTSNIMGYNGHYSLLDTNVSRPTEFVVSSSYYYELRANNSFGWGGSVKASCSLDIAYWPPTITSMPNTTAIVGKPYTYWATFNCSAIYYFMVYPEEWFRGYNIGFGTPTEPGIYQFAIMAQRGGEFGYGVPALTTWQSWNVTVIPDPNAQTYFWGPTILSTPSNTSIPYGNYSYHLIANETIGTLDFEQVDTNPVKANYLNFWGSTDRSWYITMVLPEPGNYNFTIATDSHEGKLWAYQNWTVAVNYAELY